MLFETSLVELGLVQKLSIVGKAILGCGISRKGFKGMSQVDGLPALDIRLQFLA